MDANISDTSLGELDHGETPVSRSNMMRFFPVFELASRSTNSDRSCTSSLLLVNKLLKNLTYFDLILVENERNVAASKFSMK